jgi:predicted permease
LDRAGVPVARLIADAAREGARSIARHRAFSVAIIGILSLGVGATAALVNLVDVLLFRPPAHVLAPDRLVHIGGASNYVLFQEVERGSRTLDVAAVTTRALTLGQGDNSRSIDTQCVTSGYFSVLGAVPVIGRAFQRHEDVPGGERTVVLSHSAWRRDFTGGKNVIGRAVTIDNEPHRVIGVAPPDFRGFELAPVDAWISLAASPDLCSFTGQSLLDSVSGGWLSTIGRLKPGVSLEQAEADIKVLALHAMKSPGSAPRQRELDLALSDRRPSRDSQLAVWLAAGAGLILMIACANVAGLLSVRALERRREIAVRFQLGASRARMFTQLAAENLILAVGCAVGAWGVSSVLTRALRTFFPAVMRDSWFDGRTLGTLAAFAVGSALVGGVIPALQATRLHAGLLRIGHSLGHDRARGRHALVVTQVALALVLVTGASLFAGSVRHAKRGLGYDLDRIIVVTPDFERAGVRRQAEQRRLFNEMLEKIRAFPGIEAASLSSAGPLGSGRFSTVMPSRPGADPRQLMIATVSPDYFRTFGTRIVAGRPFTIADGPGAPQAAIVDTTVAQDMWPGESVVGECKQIAPVPVGPCTLIVGLSEPRRINSLTRQSGEIFYPLAQHTTRVPQAILIRPVGPVRDAVPGIVAAIRGVFPGVPLANVRRLEDLADVMARSWRLGTLLFGLFGAVAVVLTSVGLCASLAFTVRQRTAEIGVRMALGATRGDVARMTLRQGARLIGLGWALGLVGSFFFARWIESLLFGVTPTDPLTLVLASVSICGAGAAGCLLPVLRASRIDPVVALRTD